ncbi:MAG TPA: PAS domain-containing protein, partial [Thermoanaerobaculia bacterium]
MSRTNIFLRGTTTGMVWRLLIVGALLPLFGDVLVSVGQRAGFYGAASVGMLHGLVVSTFFIAIIVAEGLSLRRVDAHRRESLRRVQESEARHRQLLDQLPHHIFSVDDDGRYVAVNAATCRFFRRTEAEIIGKTPAELGVSPGLVSLWLQQKAKTCATGMAQTLDLDIPVRGDIRSFRVITTPVRDLSGNIVGVSGIGIDTTDLRTAEAQSHRLAHAIEQLDEVVFMTDREGTITYVNPAFEKLYGFSPEEAVGKTPRILRSGELTQEFYASFWAELLAGRRTRGEYRNRRKDGTIVEVLGSASPVFGEDHSITGFI